MGINYSKKPSNEYMEKIILLKNKVEQYKAGYDQYKQQSYNETQVRVDFVNFLFQLLGWDVLNEVGLPQHLREVTHEANVTVEEAGKNRNKRPDYAFRIGTETLFFLETKKPAVDITTDILPSFQLRRYGWSGNLKISVLTNFTDLYIYDCSVRPIEGDDIGVALIAHYHYTEYVDKFDEIYRMLSKESAISGEFDKLFDALAGPFRREPFDEYFLKQIKEWRLVLGNSIMASNSSINMNTLNIAVQRILDRIIFLRICEDRSLEDYETLKCVSSFEELKSVFEAADKKYDSGLFELLEEDSISVEDNVLIDIFMDLYYPNNSYEFSVVDPYIIGQIYELFLDETLEYDEEAGVFCVEKPEAVDSQGAVNTPKNVTDIIVEKTLDPLFTGKKIEDVKNYRIADICCGSGNFLLSSFEYIVNFYINYYLENDKEGAIKRGDIYILPGSTQFYLSYKMRRGILVKNIYGVDIDPLAVEVSKFSLLLKVLEGVSIEEVTAYTKATKNHILPNLDSNIKNGNSLVGNNFAIFNKAVYKYVELLYKIKMFDWDTEFDGKFDAIVGNPPYIRVQNMVKYSPEEYAFYRSSDSGFEVKDADLLDKYQLFLEKGLHLLKDNGYLGYIVPHKFMVTKSGEDLRKLLSKNNYVCSIVHFGTNQVFKNRSTYTAILLLSKAGEEKFDIAFIEDLGKYLSDRRTSSNVYPADYISEKPWTFLNDRLMKRLKLLENKTEPLKNLADIFVGLQTSADKIYIVKENQADEKYLYFTDVQGMDRKIERGILRKSVYNTQMIKYEKIVANTFIIYPYRKMGNKVELIPIDEMKRNYPYAYEYLLSFKETLDKRNMPTRTDDTWYAYGRSQSIKRFLEGYHVIWPVLSLDSNYVFDDEMIAFTGGGNGPFYGLEMKEKIPESIFYIQAILNHWISEEIVKSKASFFRGGYYSHGKQYVAELPIIRIDFNNQDEKRLHDEIVEKVMLAMELSSKKKSVTNQGEKDALSRAIESIQYQINTIIAGMYGIDEEKGAEEDEL